MRPRSHRNRRRRRASATTAARPRLAVALLTPVFVVLLFAAVQATLWGHARTEARVAARDAAAQVARFDASPGDAQSSAQARLAGSPMTGVERVDLERSGSGGRHDHCDGTRDHRRDLASDQRDRSRPRRTDHPVTTRRRWIGDDGSSDALGMALIAPAALALAIAVLLISRGVDSRATAQSAAEAAAQAAAQQRNRGDAAGRCPAGRRSDVDRPVDLCLTQRSARWRLRPRRDDLGHRQLLDLDRRSRTRAVDAGGSAGVHRVRRDRSVPRGRPVTATPPTRTGDETRRATSATTAGPVSSPASPSCSPSRSSGWCGWLATSTAGSRTNRPRRRSHSRRLVQGPRRPGSTTSVAASSKASTRWQHAPPPGSTATQLFASYDVAGSVTSIEVDLAASKVIVTVTITDGSKTVIGVGAAEAVEVA